MQHKDLEDVIAEARASYYKAASADSAYEIHYVMGYLKSAYRAIYMDYKRLEQQKKPVSANNQIFNPE